MIQGHSASLLRLLVGLAAIIGLAGQAPAETLDQVVNPRQARGAWVSDMAGVIDTATEARINAAINDLKAKTGAEIAVVTIRRTDDRTPKEFATELFNRWGVGKRGQDNGVLVLLVAEDRRIEVETGYGIEPALPDGKVGAILDERVIPFFKRGDYGGGLLSGVKTMAGVIGKEAPSPRAAPRGRPSQQGSPRTVIPEEAPPPPADFPPEHETVSGSGHGTVVAAWLAGRGLQIVLVVVLVVLIGFLMWQSRRRWCSQCGNEMRRLTEKQDDAYLEEVQQFEEELGSLDYRVWRCDKCQVCKVERVRRLWSGYEKCPKCGNQTLRTTSHITLRGATYETEGRGQIVRTCQYRKCRHEETQYYDIPRRVRSDSSGSSWDRSSSSGSSSSSSDSSSSSFGGGSSGGGGAGRSW